MLSPDMSDHDLEVQLRTTNPLYCLESRTTDHARRMLLMMPGDHPHRARLQEYLRQREAEDSKKEIEQRRQEEADREKKASSRGWIRDVAMIVAGICLQKIFDLLWS